MRQLNLFPGSFGFISFGTEKCRVAPSVNISEEETCSERSEVSFWLLTGPDSGSNITGV